MNPQKICILVDSGCDVPENVRRQYDIRVLPLKILYPEGEYLDQVTITAQEVYDRLERDIPKTSLPDGQTIENALHQAKLDGYEKALIICISSGLSGTYNMVRIVCQEQTELETFVLDTRNISIGGGIFAVLAARWIEAGIRWDTLVEQLPKRLGDSKVFFCLDTLEYLHKGGRLGLVATIMGSALNLKPIISCNDDGVYYVVGKALGRKRSLARMLELAVQWSKKSEIADTALLNGDAVAEAEMMKPQLLAAMEKSELLTEGQISPALVVHTGPGLVGILIFRGGFSLPA